MSFVKDQLSRMCGLAVKTKVQVLTWLHTPKGSLIRHLRCRHLSVWESIINALLLEDSLKSHLTHGSETSKVLSVS